MFKISAFSLTLLLAACLIGCASDPVNECLDAALNDCTELATCVDFDPGYECQCDFPYIDDGSGCRKVNVLVLDDVDETDGNTSVLNALNAADFQVTQGPLYYNWDGADPSLTGIDTILSLEGYDYGYSHTEDAITAIRNFVAAGGGFIRTEWALEESMAFDPPLMPVQYEDHYEYGSTWTTASDTTHPLLRDITLPFESEAAFSYVSLIGEGVAAITNDAGYPIISYTTEHGGVTIHLNHDSIYTTDPIEDQALQLYVNAVHFSAIPVQ